MRSRFTAFALGEGAYLLGSWHSSTRPRHIDPSNGPHWLRLEIRATGSGGPADEAGTVEFMAHWREGRQSGTLHEVSRFVREGGQWRYLDGETRSVAPRKVGRNEPCPCGSGPKAKQCCH